jgi:predicted transcriptional regulator
MKVLLSIKPEFAEKIFDGRKCFEFRKSLYKRQGVHTVVVYVTRPVGKIVGEFDVSGVVHGSPDSLWEQTADGAGITREFFQTYFQGRERAFALAIGAVRRYESPLEPDDLIEDFAPPQSYMYVGDDLQRVRDDPAPLLI